MTSVEAFENRVAAEPAGDPPGGLPHPDTQAAVSPDDSGAAADLADVLLARTEGLVVPHLDQEKIRKRSTLTSLRVVAPLSLLLLWWASTAFGWVDEQTIPSPGSVASAFWELLTSGELWANLSVSLTRAATGLLIGVSIGLVLGLITGLYRLADGLIDPVLQMAYTVPFLAVAPLLIVWFGIDEQPKIILISVATCLPVYLNTYGGVRNTDPKVIEGARVFGVSRLRLVRQIIVPAALPSILVGLRMALSYSLLALIVVEQTNSPKGIGFLMISAQQYFQTEILLVCILLYAAWGLAAGGVVRGLGWLVQPWLRKGNIR